MNQTTVVPTYKRYLQSFFLALCLFQAASYAWASQDLTEVRRMAEQGDVEAQSKLGTMYSQGEGFPKDVSQAYVWFSLAVANGRLGSTKLRDSAAKKLTKPQLEAAQDLAGLYFEKYHTTKIPTEERAVSKNSEYVAAPVPSQVIQKVDINDGINFKGKTKNYNLKKLNDAASAHIYSIIMAKPAVTTDHPSNQNNNFKNIQIVDSPKDKWMDGGIALKANNTTIIPASKNDWRSILYTNDLDGEGELLLVGVYEGGNICDSSRQAIVAIDKGGKYNITPVFGRCNPLIYRDGGSTYFVYAPTDYYGMMILKLTSTPSLSN